MDSYRALLAASSIEIEENSSRYANPLRQLKKALGKTGSTVILLHHSSQTSSKRAVAESNAGNASFNSVPDQILSLKWLADAGADGQRRDRRIVLSASGRTGRVMPDQLLEQSPDWGWFSHGETGDALLKQNALNERDRLAGDDAIAYDLLNTRTLNGHPSTSNDIRELRDNSTGGRGNWSTTKVNRLLKKLERKGLAIQDGHQAHPGDMGGRPALLWWTFERDECLTSSNGQNTEGGLKTEAVVAGLNRAYEGLNTKYTAQRDSPVNSEKTVESVESVKSHPKQIIPCHPVESKVTYEGKVWTVAEINLATGMHTLTRPPGITKSDLRMLDLEPFIDEDEVL